MGYLIPQDAEMNNWPKYINMEDLIRACDVISSKHILLILDCCFSGILGVAGARSESQISTTIDNLYLAKITDRTAWQVLTAGDQDELVVDSGHRSDHSPFTSALLDGLKGEADVDGNNIITACELYNYVKQRVSEDTSHSGAKGQVPFFSYLRGSQSGEFVFILPNYDMTTNFNRNDLYNQRLNPTDLILQALKENPSQIIDALSSKIVLILGRFTPERKAVLDAIREELEKRDYTPILFDFEKPAYRDISETIDLLAHISKFIIADITDAKSIPADLERIVPNLPSVPIAPIIHEYDRGYSMFLKIKRYPWVLDPYRYKDQESLIASLGENVIAPAEQKVKEMASRDPF